MSFDIVERLENSRGIDDLIVMAEAASEITKLRAELAACRAEREASDAVHGPFGYLVIDPELNEEHWTLSFSSGEPEVISLPMFTKVDPFDHLPSEPDGSRTGAAS